MGDVNFGLLQPAPIKILTPMDVQQQGAQTNLANSQSNLANTSADVNRADLGFKKLDITNKLAGSVMMNPTQENLNASLIMAQQAGLDVSQIPKDLKSAMPFISNAYVSSGQALEMAKAQAQIQMAQATLGLKATDTATRLA